MKTNKTLSRMCLGFAAALVLAATRIGIHERDGMRASASSGADAESAPARTAPHPLYQCPMHPQIVQDHPGFCPICHMRLEEVDGDAAEAGPEPGGKVTRYRNPMDPTIFSDHPMKDSMGMDYIPVTQEKLEEPGVDQADAVPGKAAFSLSPERQQLIGVRTALAEVQPIALTLRLPGRGLPGGEVSAQVLEIDAGALKPGMDARLLGPDGASLGARVSAVGSTLDDLTHSLTATLRAKGPAAWLRPGMFCQVLVDAGLGRRLAVPQEAVLDTGARQVVFVVDGPGRFEPREVVLGPSGDELVEIKQGVRAGERVVSSANFLIDSESQFQSALGQFRGGRP